MQRVSSLADTLNLSAVNSVYYRKDFREVIEYHLPNLRARSVTATISINPDDAYAYEYDLYGLLAKLGYADELHWIVMRLNGYTAPHEYRADHLTLMMPAVSDIEKIVRGFQTVHTIE